MPPCSTRNVRRLHMAGSDITEFMSRCSCKHREGEASRKQTNFSFTQAAKSLWTPISLSTCTKPPDQLTPPPPHSHSGAVRSEPRWRRQLISVSCQSDRKQTRHMTPIKSSHYSRLAARPLFALGDRHRITHTDTC